MSAGLVMAGASVVRAISAEQLARVRRLESAMERVEQIPVRTEHLLHGGMYARTMRLKPGTVIVGALIERATLLIVDGRVDMLVNEGFAELDGYYVLPASAGRKQVFLARGDVAMTMIFATSAKTVEEAEEELTGEADRLISRRRDNGDTITVTGE